ncbi:response regulator [Bradyrhizobium sp. B120]|uniref:response regulator n=1 Tax=Bradyrhizobium sp. B120 TaxID=3410088 RepID=UPI003B981DF9
MESPNHRPMCHVCKHRMALAWISAGERGFEESAFECSTCGRTEKISIEVDPMMSDAVGWLTGELKPPR